MKYFRKAIIVAGALAFVVLLWKLNLRLVLESVSKIGFRIFIILLLWPVTILLNATGWRLSFEREVGRTYSTAELIRLWLAMDGINYFVPTGTIAGEVVRASMLRDVHALEVRTASVVISRIAETVAQVLFVLAGFVFLVSRITSIERFGWIRRTSGWALAVVTLLMLAYVVIVWSRGPAWGTAPPKSTKLHRVVFGKLGVYFAAHPSRFLAAVVVFMAGFAWPAVEGYLICHFIGIPISAATAVTIEVLSVAIDGALFMVPAKVGTQELGKTAIFSLLGLPLSSGAAFGIIRHIREIVWNSIGLSIYTAGRPRPERALL